MYLRPPTDIARPDCTEPRYPRVLVPVRNPLGGIRTYLLYNLGPLQRAGYRFTFVAPAGDAFESFRRDVEHWEEAEFVEVSRRKRGASLSNVVRAVLRKRTHNIIHSQGLVAGAEAALANLGTGVPHVMTLHDVIVPENDVPGRLKWVKRLMAGHLTRRIDEIIPVSEDCCKTHRRAFPSWKRGRCRITVIRNGVDVQHLQQVAQVGANKGDLRQQFNLGANVFICGFFGRFMPQKGFLVLLQALRLLRRNTSIRDIVLIATKDPHGYRNEYMRHVESDAQLRSLVRFIEPVPDIAPLLVQMDALIMPSLWEACPLLPMEAMVLGVPVIGSNAIGLREVLANTPALMPAAGDPISLSHAIEHASAGVLTPLAAAFATAARERFDVACAVDKLKVVYARVAGPAPQGNRTLTG